MEVDGDGLIYMSDFGRTLQGPPGPRVYRITPSGEVSVWAEGLVGASGNAFDSEGRTEGPHTVIAPVVVRALILGG